jgi:hypothetical protein
MGHPVHLAASLCAIPLLPQRQKRGKDGAHEFWEVFGSSAASSTAIYNPARGRVRPTHPASRRDPHANRRDYAPIGRVDL